MKPRFSRSADGFYQYFFSDPKIRAYTSTRAFNGRFEEEAPGERQRLFETLKVSASDVVGACQIHGTQVQVVDISHKGLGGLRETNAFQRTDGFVSRDAGVILSIKTADCLPLFLADPSTRAIAVIHAGWKGLKSGIVECGIATLKERYALDVSRLEAVIGPVIRREDYEVGEEFRRYFPEDVYSRSKPSKFCFDLPNACRRRLIQAGLREENILDPGLSTAGNPNDFFSYRREGEVSGRMLSLMWRVS